ncbi:MAG TPA: M23 family metallopeptidase [Kofleriaceae bacterium]|nr:M23 family metallopeptidase [Kofleriaceae bacterium]
MRRPLACAVAGALAVLPATALAIKPKVPTDKKDKPASKAPAKKPPPPKIKFTVSSTKPKPGDPILVKVTGTATMPRGTARGRRLVFYPVKGGWQSVFAVPLGDAPEAEEAPDADEPERRFWAAWHGRPVAPPEKHDDKAAPNTIKVSIVDAGPPRVLTIKPHSFPEEKIQIDPALANPPAQQAREIDADNAAVIAALRNNDPPLFKGRFRAPPGKRTSAFGNWRRFNDSEHRSRHLGLDAAARKGAPIRAVQRGKVALVRSGILMGGTVVVVHGAGIASAYFHVSDFAVKTGEVVEPGQVLGKVGVTGRTTGPHIHVGIWARGGFVDPAVFFRLPIAAPVNPDAAVAAGKGRAHK